MKSPARNFLFTTWEGGGNLPPVLTVARKLRLADLDACFDDSAFLKHVPTVIARLDSLEAAIHVALVNRGVLIAPFHNMMLISPATSGAQVNRLITAFGAVAAKLAA